MYVTVHDGQSATPCDGERGSHVNFAPTSGNWKRSYVVLLTHPSHNSFIVAHWCPVFFFSCYFRGLSCTVCTRQIRCFAPALTHTHTHAFLQNKDTQHLVFASFSNSNNSAGNRVTPRFYRLLYWFETEGILGQMGDSWWCKSSRWRGETARWVSDGFREISFLTQTFVHTMISQQQPVLADHNMCLTRNWRKISSSFTSSCSFAEDHTQPITNGRISFSQLFYTKVETSLSKPLPIHKMSRGRKTRNCLTVKGILVLCTYIGYHRIQRNTSISN